MWMGREGEGERGIAWLIVLYVLEVGNRQCGVVFVGIQTDNCRGLI